MRHVSVVFSPTPEFAKPDAPVMLVNTVLPPGRTDFVSGATVGAPGGFTVAVRVAPTNCVVESVTTYFTGDAVPVKPDAGTNVTVPFAFTV